MAFWPPSSDSSTARHMAHWACVLAWTMKIAIATNIVFVLDIIGADHEVDNDACHGNIKPDWKGVFGDFFVVFKLFCQSANI